MVWAASDAERRRNNESIFKGRMKNKAKCKKCEDIIESFHAQDYVTCKCGEISCFDGDAMRCAAKEWANFLRVDDQGNEIMVKVESDVNPLYTEKPKKEELLLMLDEMIASYDRLPPHAMNSFVTQTDLASALLLISGLFRT